MNIQRITATAVNGFMAIFGFVPYCGGALESDYNLDDLISAIALVESGGDQDAYNAKENAAGKYQIRPIYLKDVNRILGYKKYKLTDRFDPAKAKDMVYIYLRHYGRGKSLEDMARIHNGGPKGYKKKNTEKYWQKIKKELENKK